MIMIIMINHDNHDDDDDDDDDEDDKGDGDDHKHDKDGDDDEQDDDGDGHHNDTCHENSNNKHYMNHMSQCRVNMLQQHKHQNQAVQMIIPAAVDFKSSYHALWT